MKAIRKILVIALFSAILPLSLLVQAAEATDIWPMFRHDLEHTGRSEYTGPRGPVLKWKCALGAGVSYSSPAIAPDGTIYVGANDGKLYAIAPNGDLKWSYTVGLLVYSSPAIGSDGTVYVGTHRAGGNYDNCTGAVYAITDNGTYGSLKWRYPAVETEYCYDIQSSPAIDPVSGVIYITGVCITDPGPTGRMYALYPEDGSEKCIFDASHSGWMTASPAIRGDGMIIVGDYNNPTGIMWMIDPDDCSVVDYVQVPNPTGEIDIHSSVAIDAAREMIYFGGSRGDRSSRVWAYDFDLNYVWDYPTGHWVPGSPAIGSDGTVYVGSYDNKFYAFDPDYGSVKWSYQTGGDIYSSPAIDAEGTIYVGSNDHNLYAFDPDDGSVKWSYLTGGAVYSSPAIGPDNTLYVGSTDGYLYAISTCCQTTPAVFDYGEVCVGDYLDRTFTIKNGGGCESLSGSITESCDDFSIIAGGGPYTLAPDESLNVTVRFEPASFGEYLCVIETGDTLCSDITCEGIGIMCTCCGVSPTIIDFGEVCIGSSLDMTFTVTGKELGGCSGISGDITESCDDFSIIEGGGPFTLAPDESLIVQVHFEPTSIGAQMCMIETGNDSCNNVICEGLCISNCRIAPIDLDFGLVELGYYEERSFTITNVCGSDALEGSVSESCDHFSIVAGGGPYSLSPGEYVTVTVRYQPYSIGPHECVIETGSEYCSDVICLGTGHHEGGYIQQRNKIKQGWSYSEFQADDSPGLLQSSAATAADTYTVVYYDFEMNNWQGWTQKDNSFPFYGTYSGLWQGLMDKDPCGENFGTQVEFFAETEFPNYEYGGGLGDTPYCEFPSGLCQDEMIISPVIDMTMFTTRTDGIQDQMIPGDLSLLGGAHLGFTVYRDLELPSLVFYYWLVRSWDMGEPGPWLSQDLIYYGPERDYLFEIEDISSLVKSDQIQVAIGVVDMSNSVFEVYGDESYGHTPSPWIDNVYIKRYTSEGPRWSYRSIDLFQDNFPESGMDLESYVRADMAMDINNPLDYNIRPGDSVVVGCSAPVGSELATNFNGAEVYLHVKCTYIGDPFPPYGPKPDLAGHTIQGDCGVYVWDDGIWTVLQCDSVYTGTTAHPDSVKFRVDLHDSLFTRGYMIEYYFKAFDIYYNFSTLPRDAETHGTYFEFTCLPTMASDILYVDDFHGRGSMDGVAQLYMEASLEDVLDSGVWDRYDVNGPSSLVSNGPGSRAKLEHMMLAYNKVIWDSGDLRYGTISDGQSGDKSGDCRLLIDWLEGSEHDVGLWICGDNIAYDLTACESAEAFDLLDRCTVALRDDSYYELAGSDGGLGQSPCVKGVPGPIFYYEGVPDSFTVFGGCPKVNSFDVLETYYTGIPALRYYAGCNSCSYEPPGANDAYAAVMNSDTNYGGYTVRTMWFGFSFMYMRDCIPTVPMTRNKIMADVISWMMNFTNPDITDDPGSTPVYNYYLERNYPNPFNPTTTMRFGLKQKGLVKLKIYNAAGRLIKTLVDEVLPAGHYTRTWNGENDHGSKVASGVYFCRIESGSYSATKKLVLLR